MLIMVNAGNAQIDTVKLKEVIIVEENKFKYKNQKTDKYYEFKSKQLFFRTNEKVLKEYHKKTE